MRKGGDILAPGLFLIVTTTFILAMVIGERLPQMRKTWKIPTAKSTVFMMMGAFPKTILLWIRKGRFPPFGLMATAILKEWFMNRPMTGFGRMNMGPKGGMK